MSDSPLQVDMFLGFIQQVGGRRRRDRARRVPHHRSRRAADSDQAVGAEIRTEVCSPTAGLERSCLEQPQPADRASPSSAAPAISSRRNITNCC
jgi:hypothetical protein